MATRPNELKTIYHLEVKKFELEGKDGAENQKDLFALADRCAAIIRQKMMRVAGRDDATWLAPGSEANTRMMQRVHSIGFDAVRGFLQPIVQFQMFVVLYAVVQRGQQRAMGERIVEWLKTEQEASRSNKEDKS